MPSAPPIERLRHKVTSPEAQEWFKRWFDAAPIYSGPVWANERGWQVLRTRAKNRAIQLRRSLLRRVGNDPIADVLDRDGIVVLEGFLPPEDHARLSAACDAYAASSRVRDIGSETGAGIRYLSGPVLSDERGDPADVIVTLLGNDERVITLARHVIGRSVRGPLRVIFQQLELGEAPRDDLDREQILHADKAFACVKAIYAVDAITEDTSPFVYCKGSHRITPARLRYERAMSVREAHLRRGELAAVADRDDGITVERSRHVMTQATREELGLTETPMVCPANSMIITNNAGFHRRGELQPGARRRTLWVNFYPYQRPWYGRAAHRITKAFIDTDNVTRTPSAIHRQDEVHPQGEMGQESGQ